ncbi:accessory gene regulator B family protein [Paenibacillus kobensis]|uniref:accessory gene regulator B family protein n=1 Tax=Paenibacillus kobensis TaxID=59841 RepID=UPI001FE778E4|nr:accessory gene regulator B family protein [Paenibacillus kobensis]
MVIEVSRRITRWVKNENPAVRSSEERFTALLALQISNYFPIIIALVLGFVSGKAIETIIGAVSVVSIRIMTGGGHFKNLDHCFIFSTIILATIPHISLNNELIFALTSASIVLVLTRSEQRKLFPIIIIVLNFFFVSSAAALAFIVQGISLTIKGR